MGPEWSNLPLQVRRTDLLVDTLRFWESLPRHPQESSWHLARLSKSHPCEEAHSCNALRARTESASLLSVKNKIANTSLTQDRVCMQPKPKPKHRHRTHVKKVTSFFQF